jgi:hypothetical protein
MLPCDGREVTRASCRVTMNDIPLLQLEALRPELIDPAARRLPRLTLPLGLQAGLRPRHRMLAGLGDGFLAFGAVGAARPDETAHGLHPFQLVRDGGFDLLVCRAPTAQPAAMLHPPAGDVIAARCDASKGLRMTDAA